MKDTLKIKGVIEIFDATGRLVYIKQNLLTNNGAELFSDRFLSNAVDAISHLGIGDGVGTYDKTATALNNEIYRQGISSSSSPGASIEYIFNIPSDQAVGTWTGLGLFNNVVAGVMSNVVNISYEHLLGESVQVKWTITVVN